MFISNDSQLALLNYEYRSADETIYLVCDIDLGSYKNWSPIFNFNGTLDGRNFAFNNLTINIDKVTSSRAYGLFSDLPSTAVVKNLNFRNTNIYFAPDHSTVQCNVGVVAGSNYGTIENVNVYGKVEVARVNSFMGGIVGKNYNGGTIKNCVNYTTMIGNGDMGGIAGQNYSGTSSDGKGIINCVNYGDYYFYVIQNRSVGGVVGVNRGALSLCNNYGMFYFKNTDTSLGSAEYDYRVIPRDKNLKPQVGGIIGFNDKGYFDQTGNIGYYEGFNYTVGPGYDQVAYFYKNYGGRVGRI